MKNVLMALTLAATSASAAGSAAAQAADFEWSGTVAPGKTIQIRAANGTVRAVASEDGRLHVDARLSDPASVHVEVVEHDEGVTVCAVLRRSECRSPRDGNGNVDVRDSDARVDFVVRVPAGVRFTGGTINGDITVGELRSEVNVATIDGDLDIQTTGFAVHATTIRGNVTLHLPAAANADFHVNTVSGTIDSDFPLRLNRGRALPDGRPIFLGPTGPQIVRATIGGGGPALGVITVSGNIRVRRR